MVEQIRFEELLQLRLLLLFSISIYLTVKLWITLVPRWWEERLWFVDLFADVSLPVVVHSPPQAQCNDTELQLGQSWECFLPGQSCAAWSSSTFSLCLILNPTTAHFVSVSLGVFAVCYLLPLHNNAGPTSSGFWHRAHRPINGGLDTGR